jgi:hypothetical protein
MTFDTMTGWVGGVSGQQCVDDAVHVEEFMAHGGESASVHEALHKTINAE